MTKSKSPVGHRIFLQLNSTVLIGCVHLDVQVLRKFLKLQKEAQKSVYVDDPKIRISEVIAMFFNH
jgi:hypothetical protein